MRIILNLSWFVYNLVIIIWAKHSNASNTALVPSSAKNNGTCNVLKTNSFHVYMECITLSPNTVSELATSPEQCREMKENSKCNVIYWNKLGRCLRFSYDAFKMCPVTPIVPTTDSILYLGISRNIPENIKKVLLDNGYRYDIQRILGCNVSSFLCDNFECIDKKLRCDGIAHCQDHSDENRCNNQQKCFGRDGEYYGVGMEYVPNNELDQCKACVCGDDGLPSYCYSPICGKHLSCSGTKQSICCICFAPHQLHDKTKTDYLERLLLGCVFTTLFLSIGLVFSRQIIKNYFLRRQTFHDSWRAMRCRDLPRNRSFFETPARDVEVLQRPTRSVSSIDVPPSYSTVVSGGSPPSYLASTRNQNRDVTNVNSSIPLPSASPDITLTSRSEPNSPLSTNSNCPLLTVESRDSSD